LIDLEADRSHPYKKNRPLASGKIEVHEAVFMIVFGLILGLTIAYGLNYYVFICGLAYLFLQVAYSTYLKNIPIIDLIVIASGYLIRVYAGAMVISAHIDVWFLMTVIAASLFLAVGKRRGEMTLLLHKYKTGETRATLKRYTEQLLDIYTAMFATATWITYSMFSFNHPKIVPDGRALNLISILPRTLVSEKWMMMTIPLVVYGVMRYLQLIYEKNEGESPERIILSDRPLLFTGVTWILLVIGVIYYIG
jgi:4-hydroxybenzoate polyprenyltransferase